MGNITVIAPKLSPLLLMLSSTHDGEVVNAARAIERTLRAAGADWHDLAGAIARSPNVAPPEQQAAPDHWRRMVRFCRQHLHRLSDSERKFIGSMARWSGDPTQKQSDWLHAIYLKLGGHDQ